jgi:beta-ribofuranosylaminobenzene 5'-phosphate synthase
MTQLALGILKSILTLEGETRDILEMAEIVGRGGTSGIGLWAFDRGGFVLDAGHSTDDKMTFAPSHYSKAKPPELLWHSTLPDDWYFVVAIPEVGRQIYGAEEKNMFECYCPIPREEVAEVSHMVLIGVLPSVLHNDIQTFGRSLSLIQNTGFKRIENDLQGDFIRRLLEVFIELGAVGSGLSSFGPATYGVVKGKESAEALTESIRRYLQESGINGRVFYSNTNNEGAKICGE